LAPNEFWLLLKKTVIRGEDFTIPKTKKKKVTTALEAVAQLFQKCFQQWQHHWA
jgi:hypothetical protein